MRRTFFKYTAVISFVVLSAAMLMHVSQNVQKLEREISYYDREIEQEQEKTRVLKAEWAYLNNPERLEALAIGGYGMQAPESKNILTSPLKDYSEDLSSILPSSGTASGASSQNKDLSLHPQERYGRSQ